MAAPLTRLTVSVAVVGLVVAAMSATSVASQQAALDPQGSVAVVVTYADGRSVPMIVGPMSVGCSSTENFVRVQGWTPPPNQLPVRAVRFNCTRVPQGIRVAVSVFRGTEREKDEPVAIVSLAPGQSMVVSELRAVGVEPVTLTLRPLAMPDASLPALTTPSPDIELVSLSFVEKPVPRYVMYLVNHSAKAVRSLEVMLMRDGRPMRSIGAADDEGQVLMAPGGSVGLQLQISARPTASSGAVTMVAADRIVITGLLWADGSFAGDASYARYEAAFYFGQRAQLAHVIAELDRARAAGVGATATGLRAALGNLSVEATDAMIDEARQDLAPNIAVSPADARRPINQSLAQIKKLALSDLTTFESGPPLAGSLQAWITTTIDRYQRWHDRLAVR